MAVKTQPMILLGLALVSAGVFIHLASARRKSRRPPAPKWLWLSGAAFLIFLSMWFLFK